MKVRLVGIGLVLSGAAILVACGTEGESVEETSTLVASSAVPSKLAEPELGSGQPPIPFDPCLDIDPAVLRDAGLDPATLERKDLVGDVTSSIGCSVDGDELAASIFARNGTYDEELADDRQLRRPDRPSITETSINGRDAFYGLSRTGDSTCPVVMRTGFGHVYIDGLLLNDRTTDGQVLDLCTETVRIATAIEPSLPGGN
ncbi:DUF3558 domain-containing protein [Aldersonia sp. NBC_00410]|uniref:DUF3558 domain-containing protein n=1 Tax=Aldersonia sp. NBC_00410 TaxID=2975954 RepID=UPI0022542804|nr:DUF3558 domain-containing protein [Aldersonia sp. NBC_00410]MCX5043672.1 DUF3558 domain-containing protein [Aldersonia sp. NBC_00410]